VIKIQPPSVIGTYDLISSLDDALISPDVSPLPDETEAARETRVAALWEAWRRDLNAARETGRWDGMIRKGAVPSRFHLRQIPGSTWARLKDLGDAMTQASFAALIVRVALVGATDWIPGFKVGPSVEHVDAMGAPTGLGRVGPESVIDAFYSAHPGAVADRLVLEIAEQVIRHRTTQAGN
jgi:hypothetical protein